MPAVNKKSAFVKPILKMRNLQKKDFHTRPLPIRLYTSRDVKYLLGIKSDTTLIKLERAGKIKVHGRLGNQKRYCPKHISKLMSAEIEFSN